MTDYYLVVEKQEVPVDPQDPQGPQQQVVRNTYIETNIEQIVRNLNSGQQPLVDYYKIQFNGEQLQTTLHPVNLKAGPRAPGRTLEVAEAEVAGQVVGSAEVVVTP